MALLRTRKQLVKDLRIGIRLLLPEDPGRDERETRIFIAIGAKICHLVAACPAHILPTFSRKASSRIFENWPLAGTSLVARVGFEPTTSGL
jgi:hypothetical protein